MSCTSGVSYCCETPELTSWRASGELLGEVAPFGFGRLRCQLGKRQWQLTYSKDFAGEVELHACVPAWTVGRPVAALDERGEDDLAPDIAAL